MEDKYFLETQANDSPFAYHMVLIKELKSAILENRIEKYHFNFLRNLLEKTATFLGYDRWSDCVILFDEQGNQEDASPYVRRINLHSHSSYSEYETSNLSDPERNVVKRVFEQFLVNFRFFDDNQ